MILMNLSIKWDVNSLTLYFISTFPRWVRLRVKSKMMESSLRATSSNRKIIESLGILGCLMVNHLLWGHDLIKTNDSYNKSLFSVDGGFKWKKATFDFQWVLNRFKRNMAGYKNMLSSNSSSNGVMLTLLNFCQPKENQCSLFLQNFLTIITSVLSHSKPRTLAHWIKWSQQIQLCQITTNPYSNC